MLIDEAKLGFVHIPRTGGTSVETALIKKYGFVGRSLIAQPQEKAIVKVRNITTGEYEYHKKHARYDELIGFAPNYKYYTLVRHPLNRVESLYRFLTFTKVGNRRLVETPFEEWVPKLIYGGMYGVEFLDTPPYLIDLSMITLKQVDFIGKSEVHKLEDQTIWDALKIAPMKVFNLPNYFPIKWNLENVKIVEKYYAEDYELLGYD
tara:strand:- start:1361 stop:1978 length:618 start_codon:yes stop_codon:yes gene_type:complete